METREDVVSELQHSLMNAHVLLKKIKAIYRQLNAAHTILLMKQSTGSEQVTEFVQEIRLKLELFHEEMIHQMTKAFQEKTTYLNTCMHQLQHEETTIGQLCSETEGLLKQVTKTVSPVQIQKGKTLLEAFKIMSTEHSADLEIGEDVIYLDFVPQKQPDEYSNFGNIRVKQNDNCVIKVDKVTNGTKKQSVSRACQTEILFKGYCPFCGRSYSKGKKDVEVQASVDCVECGLQSDLEESETFWKTKLHNEGSLEMGWIDDEKKTRKGYLEGLKSAPEVRLVRKMLDSVGMSKRRTSDDSSSSYPEEPNSSPHKTCYRINGQGDERPTRKKMPLAGKKLKNMNDRHLEEIWNSSDDDMEEATKRLSCPLTFAAAVKHSDKEHPEKPDIKLGQTVNERSSQSPLKPKPPPVIFKEHLAEPVLNTIKEKKVKKRILAAESLSMLSGLMQNAKAENIINPHHVDLKELKTKSDSDWWGKSPVNKKLEPTTSLHKPKIAETMNSQTNMGSVPECWYDEESDAVSSSSLTSTPKQKKDSILSGSKNLSEAEKGQEEFRLRRPSFNFQSSIKTASKSSNIKPEIDANNNTGKIIDVSLGNSAMNHPDTNIASQSSYAELEKFGMLKPNSENQRTNDKKSDSHVFNTTAKLQADNSSVVDSGWEEESFMSESKESVNFLESPEKEIATYVKGSEIRTETIIKLSTTSKPYAPNKVNKSQAKNDWGPLNTEWKPACNGKSETNSQRIHSARYDWEPKNDTTKKEVDSVLGLRNSNNLQTSQKAIPKVDLKIWDADSKSVNNNAKYSINNSQNRKTEEDDWETECTQPPIRLPRMVKDLTVTATDQHNRNSSQVVREVQISNTDKNTAAEDIKSSSSNTRTVVIGKSMSEVPPKDLLKPSPIAAYMEKVSKDASSKILPPLPAKLIMKIGGRDTNLHFPIGVATTSKGEIIIADTGNHLVKIFTPTGVMRLTIGMTVKPLMQRPSAIVVNKTDELFVKDDKCIRVFDIEQGDLIRFMGKNQLSQPYGLSWTPEGHLLTLDVDKRNPRIVIFSQHGELMNSFPFTPLQGRVPQTRCRFLDVNHNSLVVSDLGRHEIYVTDLQGKMKTCFGRGGYGNREFFEPSGVVVDNRGNMIIADSKNDRLQVFRPDGTFVCIVSFSEPIKRPSDIHLTNDGRLIVVNFLNHQLKIYKLGE